MRIKSIFFLLLLMCIANARIANAMEPYNKINSMFSAVLTTQDSIERQNINNEISALFIQLLENGELSEAYADSIKNIGKISSLDNRITVYTWNIPFWQADLYNCVVQTSDGKIYRCKPTFAQKPDEVSTVSTKNWYGALYYSITELKAGKDKYYALAGVAKTGRDTKIKVIDILNINNEEIEFGLPIFEKAFDYYGQIQKKMFVRAVFEYDGRTNMYLEYNKKRKRFEFDHLSAMDIVDGKITSYGADFSIDSYVYKKNKLIFVEDIKVKGAR